MFPYVRVWLLVAAMADHHLDRTPVDTPAALRIAARRAKAATMARRERPTLSDIDVTIPSLPPPPRPSSSPPDATEAERLWHELAEQRGLLDSLRVGQEGLDRTTRATAASYARDRLPQRLRGWATLVVAVGGAVAAILGALR